MDRYPHRSSTLSSRDDHETHPTDRELETPLLDSTPRQWGHDLSLVPDGISERELCSKVRDCDILLMCYTPITARVIESAANLKGIIKYGVGIEAIDIPAALRRICGVQHSRIRLRNNRPDACAGKETDGNPQRDAGPSCVSVRRCSCNLCLVFRHLRCFLIV